ncbi:MAG: hypothetical protein J0I50_00820, partial [Microbacterium sp.]|nr:hypothetical protein [Microbacterium sp.]
MRTGGKALVWAGSAVVVVGLGALAAPVISDLTGSLAGSPAKPLATATAVADASRTRPSPTSSPTDGTTHLVGLGQGVSIPAGGPGDCTASSDINIMSTGGGPYHATLLGPDLVDTGPRQFAEGTAGRDREGRISTYTVASGDALFAIGDRFSASLGGDERARVDLVMARLFTESSFERALEICDRALEIPDAAPATRVQLLAVRALNCANAADPEGLRDSIRRGRAEADDRRDLVALATLDASESVLTFYESRYDDTLRLQRDALRRIADSGTLASLWLPEGLWMAFMRNSLGECRAALRDVDTGLAEARRAHNVIAEAFWMMVRARVLYDLGALEDARTQAEAVLDLASELQLGDFANATAGVVLFRISLHTGDRVLRDQTRPLVTALAEGRGLTRTGRWNLAVEALDAGRFDDARALSSLALEGLDQPAPAMTTPADLLDDLLLAEVCLGARDTDALDRVRVTVAARADANPDRPAVQAVELAVRGLADRSESLL